MKLSGRVWKFGNELGATDLLSPAYDSLGMGRKWDECAKHALEEVNPDFASQVQKGDILVAGENLGTGHAHYYAAAIMGPHAAGVAAMLGETLGALFQRAAIDLGVPACALPGISAFVSDGDRLSIDLATGEARNETTGETRSFPPVSPIILEILDAGGSSNWALRRVGREDALAA